jgi:predicted SAM-dependent methyltransferase
VKLIIGCGTQRRPGYLTLDADPAGSPDFVAALPPLPDEVRAERWDVIEMIHFIEHLFPWDAEVVLRQIFECLNPGGTFVLEQPDLLFAARVLAGVQEPLPGTAPGQCDMWVLYGDPTHQNPLFGHRWGYSPETLTEALLAAGFQRENIAVLPAQYHVPARDFRIEARR